jgi:predicted nucleic acid-binding protein
VASVIVLDAGALIALLNDRDAHHEWALQMFIDTVAEDLAISALNLAEALVHPTKAGRYQEFMESIQGLGLEVQGLDQADVSSLATLRAESGLRMRDSIALHLALRSDSALATTDRALGKAALGASLRVLQPTPLTSGTP